MGFWTSGALRLKVAGSIVAAVSIGGFAVAAASVIKEPAPNVVADPTTTDPTTTNPTTTEPTTTPTDPPVTEPTTTPTDPPAAEPPPVVDPTPPVACLTHGERVSKVAHDTPPGPGHGAAVSKAAHDHEGECTKADDDATEPAPPVAQAPDDQGDDPGDQSDQHGPPAPAPAPTGTSGSGDGGGHGGGHGHGGGD